MNPITLNKLSYHLKNISQEDWERLFQFIPLIKEHESFGKMKAGEKDAKGIIEFPYVIPHKVVDDFTDIMYKLNLVIDFDWGKWTAGSKIVANGSYKNHNEITLIKILTAIIRKDRFQEGLLAEAFENGTIGKILSELKRKY